MDVKIKKFKVSDNEKVAEFFRGIFNEMGWSEYISDSINNPQEYFRHHNGTLLIAKEDEKIVGTSGIIPLSDGNAVLKRFYVGKDYRGKGFAKNLLNKSIEIAKEKKFKSMFLDVTKENTRAIKFYEKNNFIAFTPEVYSEWYESGLPKSFIYYKINL